MKKRMLALILALTMALMAGCAGGNAPDETNPATTQAPVPTTQATVPATEAPAATTEAPVPTTVPTTVPTEAPTEPVEMLTVQAVAQDIYFPLLETVGDAVLQETGMLNEDTFILIYSDADEADLNDFLTLCAYCGLFSYGGTQADGTVQYNLLRPGSDYMALLILMPETGILEMRTPVDCYAVTEDSLGDLIDYYMQDLVLPTGYGPNVHPQFYASIGTTAPDSAALVDNYFGGEPDQCWREVYTKVDYPTLHKYLSDMMLCGFDIWYKSIEPGENGVLNTMILWLENGTSALMIVYHADSGMANLFYQPGIDRYLLSGTEYATYIPRN